MFIKERDSIVVSEVASEHEGSGFRIHFGSFIFILDILRKMFL